MEEKYCYLGKNMIRNKYSCVVTGHLIMRKSCLRCWENTHFSERWLYSRVDSGLYKLVAFLMIFSIPAFYFFGFSTDNSLEWLRTISIITIFMAEFLALLNARTLIIFSGFGLIGGLIETGNLPQLVYDIASYLTSYISPNFKGDHLLLLIAYLIMFIYTLYPIVYSYLIKKNWNKEQSKVTKKKAR